MPHLAKYVCNSDIKEINDIWNYFNERKKTCEIIFGHHYKYENGIWTIYFAFPTENIFNEAKNIQNKDPKYDIYFF